MLMRTIKTAIKRFIFISALMIFVMGVVSGIKMAVERYNNPIDVNAQLEEAAKVLDEKQYQFVYYDFSQPPKGNRETFYGDSGAKTNTGISSSDISKVIEFFSLDDFLKGITIDTILEVILQVCGAWAL